MRPAAAAATTICFFGASFGLVARSSGMAVLAPFVMSEATSAGSAHFAAASILVGSVSAVAAITTAVLLNARYVPISISVARLFHGRRLRRLARVTTDRRRVVGARPGGRAGRFNGRILIGAADIGAEAAAIAVRAPLPVVIIVAAATTARAGACSER